MTPDPMSIRHGDPDRRRATAATAAELAIVILTTALATGWLMWLAL